MEKGGLLPGWGSADQQKIRTFTPAGRPWSSGRLPLQYHSPRLPPHSPPPPVAFVEDRPSGLAKGAPQEGQSRSPSGLQPRWEGGSGVSVEFSFSISASRVKKRVLETLSDANYFATKSSQAF